MKEVYLYKKLKDKKVQCRTCAHYCIIENGERGKCYVKENQDGKLYSLVYGKPCAVNIDPIEKKPFFHFLPGTQSLSIATVGCSFACFSCQNWAISQGPKIFKTIEEGETPPEKIPTEHIELCSRVINVPLIAGGGVQNKKDAREFVEAGADIVVMGTFLENNLSNLKGKK